MRQRSRSGCIQEPRSKVAFSSRKCHLRRARNVNIWIEDALVSPKDRISAPSVHFDHGLRGRLSLHWRGLRRHLLRGLEDSCRPCRPRTLSQSSRLPAQISDHRRNRARPRTGRRFPSGRAAFLNPAGHDAHEGGRPLSNVHRRQALYYPCPARRGLPPRRLRFLSARSAATGPSH